MFSGCFRRPPGTGDAVVHPIVADAETLPDLRVRVGLAAEAGRDEEFVRHDVVDLGPVNELGVSRPGVVRRHMNFYGLGTHETISLLIVPL